MWRTQGAVEAPYGPRFHVEAAPDAGRLVVIPAQRSLFLVIFLTLWLGGWSAGGVAAMADLAAHPKPFLAFWLLLWAVGEVMAVSTLLWMLAGRETLRVVGEHLEVSATLFGFGRRKLYRVADIRDLSSSVYQTYRYGRVQMDVPFLKAPTSGAVKFSYGARTLYAGVALDEAEGRMIVEALKPRLPKTAF